MLYNPCQAGARNKRFYTTTSPTSAGGDRQGMGLHHMSGQGEVAIFSTQPKRTWQQRPTHHKPARNARAQV